MKKRLLVLLSSMTYLLVSGQQPAINEYSVYNEFYVEDFNENFGKDDIPEQWMDESAVILAKYTHYDYDREFLGPFRFQRRFRIRVKLNDRKAVEQFATMTFPKSFGSSKFFQGIKVMKESGEVMVYDANEIGKEEELSIGYFKRQRLKVAVPNLEPGDILDYYQVQMTSYLANYPIRFDPVIYEIAGAYPVKYQYLSFDLDKRVYLNLRSMNGAPDLLIQEDEKNKLFYVEVRDVDAIEQDIMMFPYRSIPYIKLKVTYAPDRYAGSIPFTGRPGFPKTEITEFEILQQLAKSEDQRFAQSKVKVNKQIKKTMKDHIMDHDSIVSLTYYYLRYLNQVRKYELDFLNNPNFAQYAIGNFYSMKSFSSVLTKNGIRNYYFVTSTRNFSSLEDVAFPQELIYGVYVETPHRKYYVTDFNFHDDLELTHPMAQGNSAIFWRESGSTVNPLSDRFREAIPVKEANESVILNRQKVLWNPADDDLLLLESRKEVSGTYKAQFQEKFVDYYDVYGEEERMFGPLPELDPGDYTKRRSYLMKRPKKKTEQLETHLNETLSFELDTARDLSIVQTGRFGDPFVMSYSVKTRELLSNAGENKILAIGKLVERPFKEELTEDRSHDVYLENTGCYKTELELVAPANYTIVGIEQLALDVENETGYFRSTATSGPEGVKLSTEHCFLSTYVKKEQWPLLLDHLRASEAFSKSKVLLKNIE